MKISEMTPTEREAYEVVISDPEREWTLEDIWYDRMGRECSNPNWRMRAGEVMRNVCLKSLFREHIVQRITPLGPGMKARYKVVEN